MKMRWKGKSSFYDILRRNKQDFTSFSHKITESHHCEPFSNGRMKKKMGRKGLLIEANHTQWSKTS